MRARGIGHLDARADRVTTVCSSRWREREPIAPAARPRGLKSILNFDHHCGGRPSKVHLSPKVDDCGTNKFNNTLVRFKLNRVVLVLKLRPPKTQKRI
jgi:hypothetical protein